MYSFEGNFRKKRTQVLDHTEKLSPGAIVQKTREERMNRQLRRLQEEAAVKIQALVRRFLAQKSVARMARQVFDSSAHELQNFSKQEKLPTVDANNRYPILLIRLLYSFNMCCSDKPDRERLLTLCRLFLSEHGRTTRLKWLLTKSFDPIYAIGRCLAILVKFLAQLHPQTPSSDYALAVRVLEETFILPTSTTCGFSDSLVLHQLYSHLAWLCSHLATRHYFRQLACFMNNQLPPTAGYLSNSDSSSQQFDLQEFLKPARTRVFLDLILAPIKCVIACSELVKQDEVLSKSCADLYKNLIIASLNDILVPDRSIQYDLNERIVRGLGSELLKSPLSRQVIIGECLQTVRTDSLKCDCSNSFSLIPSISLLYLLTTVVVPNVIDPSSTEPLHNSPDCDMNDLSADMNNEDDLESADALIPAPIPFRQPISSSASPIEAANMIRCLARLLIQTLFEPGLPSIRPITNPKPLQLQFDAGQDFPDSDEDSDTDDIVSNACSVLPPASNAESHRKDNAFELVWNSQLREIFSSLQHTLPALAATALKELRSCPNDHPSDDQLELIRCASQLHYCLSHVYGLPVASLIRINFIYSEHAIFLRSLWHLIQTTKTPSPHNFTVTANGLFIFNLIAAGELPPRFVELQTLLPMVFTFAECLHHRLLCLTDTEICGTSPTPLRPAAAYQRSGCGFKADELLQVGSRLRDFMLGLIDLSHPDRLPKHPANSDLDKNFDPYSNHWDGQADYKAVLERVEQRAEIAALGIAPNHDVLMRDQMGWSAQDLRLQLHCWTSLFRRIQRLVFQIYDWDRRCRPRHDIASDYYFPTDSLISPTNFDLESRDSQTDAKNKPRIPVGTPTASQTFWIKEDCGDVITLSSQSWLRHRGDQATLKMTGAPFGYYSILNPDRNHGTAGPFALSSREVRQVLLLKEIPFVIPFERRVKLFQILINTGENSRQADSIFPYLERSSNQVSIVVRRTHIYEDAFEKLSKENEPSLHPRLKVRFLNEVGVEELGIDGGGLSREFLSDLIRTGFDPTRGFFIYTADKTLYPNPQASVITSDYLKHYYFLGRILAKAIYEGMLVELQFAHFFLAKLVSRSGGGVGFDYLRSLDPQLYKHLLDLKNYTGNVKDLALDFTVMQSTFGQSKAVELKPGGRHIPVTEENRVEYVHLVAHYKLNKLIYPHVRAFTAGLNDVICTDWLRMFDAEELQTLISGADMVIDVDDLQRHTNYVANSRDFTETLDSFWSVLRSLSESDKRSFLRFVTACSRPPMFGFRDLQPPFTIQVIQETERLPTSSTCMNLLRLPDLRKPQLIRDRLLYALNANAGFEYS